MQERLDGSTIGEVPLDLGQQRLYVSMGWGGKFVKLLEQKVPLFSALSQDAHGQLKNALEMFEVPGIVNFIGEESEKVAAALFRIKGLPWRLIGARVGKEQLGGERIEPTSAAVLLEIQQQLGLLEKRPNLGMINASVAGREKDTVVLILDFDKLPLEEQKKLLKVFRRGRLSKCKIVICSSSSIECLQEKKRRFGLF